MFSDHYVVIAEGCVASDDKAQHEASMFLMRHRFDVAPAAEIAATWAHGESTRETVDQWASSTGA
jgi:hypothetical protein